MSKKIKNVFFCALTFEKFLEAEKRARNLKTNRCEVMEFEANLEINLLCLIDEIKSGKYIVGNYSMFKIYEPKERIIEKLPYRDRVVHQWYVHEFIIPNFVPKFITNSYACIEGRGTHKAVIDLQCAMRKAKRKYGSYWILKCDVLKFFYNINPYILYLILEKKMADKDLLAFTKKILFQKREKNIGIPIGNLCSQFFANIYLNELDQYILRNIKPIWLGRYMDDFVLLLKTKQEAKKAQVMCEEFLAEALELKLNAKTKYYPAKMGVDFCGYTIFETHSLLRVCNKRKIKKKVKYFNNLYLNGKLDLIHASFSINSWEAHARHCSSFLLVNKVISSCEFIYNEKREQARFIDEVFDWYNI